MLTGARRKALEVVRVFSAHEVARAVIAPFVLQRALLVGLVFLATRLLPSQQGVQPIPRVPLVESWVRWDSIYYLIAAQHGYGTNPWADVDAVFPAYPWLVRGVSLVMPVPVAAFVVANLCALGALVALYYLARGLDDRDRAERCVWLALLFPSSFFLSAVNATSTCLFALTGCVLAWQRRQPAWAAGLAAVATLAHPVGGVCLLVPFGLAWLLRGAQRQEAPWFLLGVAAGASLLVVTHQAASGDPLAFLHALGGPPYVRSAESWRAVLLDEGAVPGLGHRLLDWSSVVLVAVASVHLLRRRQLELGLICLATLAMPLLVQRSLFDPLGMTRYALLAFPIFLVLPRWTTGELLGRAVAAGFAMLQIIVAVLFTTWRWAL